MLGFADLGWCYLGAPRPNRRASSTKRCRSDCSTAANCAGVSSINSNPRRARPVRYALDARASFKPSRSRAATSINCSVSGAVRIGERALLGAGAALRDNISIGAACVVGVGTVILRDTPPESVFAAPEAVHLPISSGRMRL